MKASTLVLLELSGAAAAWYFSSKAPAVPVQAPQPASAQGNSLLSSPGVVSSLAGLVTPDATASYTTVGGQSVPMSGTLNVLGMQVPYNLNPSYSPIYQQYAAGPVNSAVSAGILSNPTVDGYIALAVLTTMILMAVSNKAGKESVRYREA